MTLFKKIIEESKAVNNKFSGMDENTVKHAEFIFDIDKEHPRYKKIKNYKLIQWSIENLITYQSDTCVVILDKNIAKFAFIKTFLKNKKYKHHRIKSEEATTKTLKFLDRFIEKELSTEKFTTLIVMWGWLLTNCGAYIAEKLQKNLILIPTTVLSMADNSGGKVRINHIIWNTFHKHYYKSFYEPNKIIIDKRFLDHLSQNEKKIWLAEVIKHALFQSNDLYNYLINNAKKILENNKYLLKAILRTIDLKRICLKIDINESETWSKTILRAGHDISDKIEERMKFTIPHGYAVMLWILEELKQNKDYETLEKAERIFNIFWLLP